MMQRKPPVKRAFTGMVGLPPEPVDVPVAPAATVSEPVAVEAPIVPKKPGRPSKYGTAMTPAQRKAESRKLQSEKLADKERRDIVAKFVQSYRLTLPRTRIESNTIEHRQWVRKFHDELMTLSLSELQRAFKVWEEIPDLMGRLEDERSGEADRKYGMSEIERMISKRQTNTGRVTPEGQNPIRFENEKYRESNRRLPSTPGYAEHIAFLENREKIIGELVAKFYDPERSFTLKDYEGEHHFEKKQCQLCGAVIPDPSDARQHFWVEYGKGFDSYEKYLELNEPGVTQLAPFIVEEARLRYIRNKHLQCVWSLVRVRREDRRQETRKTRKALRTRVS